MKPVEENLHVAISGDWFTAHGKGINLGWFCKDENTCILCIRLTEGISFFNGTRYDIDFLDNW